MRGLKFDIPYDSIPGTQFTNTSGRTFVAHSVGDLMEEEKKDLPTFTQIGSGNIRCNMCNVLMPMREWYNHSKVCHSSKGLFRCVLCDYTSSRAGIYTHMRCHFLRSCKL